MKHSGFRGVQNLDVRLAATHCAKWVIFSRPLQTSKLKMVMFSVHVFIKLRLAGKFDTLPINVRMLKINRGFDTSPATHPFTVLY